MSDETNHPRIVRGAEAIGAVIDEPKTRRVFYLLEKGHVPGAFKEGNIWALSVPVFVRARHGETAA